ncbi:hypothetical protein ABPG73_004618 [Tetrahymena malaccensis]
MIPCQVMQPNNTKQKMPQYLKQNFFKDDTHIQIQNKQEEVAVDIEEKQTNTSFLLPNFQFKYLQKRETFGFNSNNSSCKQKDTFFLDEEKEQKDLIKINNNFHHISPQIQHVKLKNFANVQNFDKVDITSQNESFITQQIDNSRMLILHKKDSNQDKPKSNFQYEYKVLANLRKKDLPGIISKKLKVIRSSSMQKQIQNILFKLKCAKTKEFLQSKGLQYNQLHMIRQEVKKSLNIYEFFKDIIFLKKAVSMLLSQDQIAALQFVSLTDNFLNLDLDKKDIRIIYEQEKKRLSHFEKYYLIQQSEQLQIDQIERFLIRCQEECSEITENCNLISKNDTLIQIENKQEELVVDAEEKETNANFLLPNFQFKYLQKRETINFNSDNSSCIQKNKLFFDEEKEQKDQIKINSNFLFPISPQTQQIKLKNFANLLNIDKIDTISQNESLITQQIDNSRMPTMQKKESNKDQPKSNFKYDRQEEVIADVEEQENKTNLLLPSFQSKYLQKQENSNFYLNKNSSIQKNKLFLDEEKEQKEQARNNSITPSSVYSTNQRVKQKNLTNILNFDKFDTITQNESLITQQTEVVAQTLQKKDSISYNKSIKYQQDLPKSSFKDNLKVNENVQTCQQYYQNQKREVVAEGKNGLGLDLEAEELDENISEYQIKKDITLPDFQSKCFKKQMNSKSFIDEINSTPKQKQKFDELYQLKDKVKMTSSFISLKDQNQLCNNLTICSKINKNDSISYNGSHMVKQMIRINRQTLKAEISKLIQNAKQIKINKMLQS